MPLKVSSLLVCLHSLSCCIFRTFGVSAGARQLPHYSERWPHRRECFVASIINQDFFPKNYLIVGCGKRCCVHRHSCYKSPHITRHTHSTELTLEAYEATTESNVPDGSWIFYQPQQASASATAFNQAESYINHTRRY